MTPENPNLARELVLLLVLATLWGSSYTFIKIGVETIPPVTLIAVRTLIAGAILLAVLRHRHVRLPSDRATWRLFVVQACLNSVIPFTLIAWAEQSVDAGLAVILNSATPIFTFLLTVSMTRHEQVAVRKLFGVVAGLAGICLVVGVEALGGLGESLMAQLAIILATICYAGAAIFSKNFRGLDPGVPAAGSLISGAVILMPISSSSTGPGRSIPRPHRCWCCLPCPPFRRRLPLRSISASFRRWVRSGPHRKPISGCRSALRSVSPFSAKG